MNAAREQAERTADRLRAELMSTLQELDRRRHRALDVRFQLQRHRPLVVSVAAGLVLLATGAVALGILRARARRENLLHHRVRGLMRAWDNPDRIASPDSDGTTPFGAARKVAMAVAVTLATQVAKRGVQRLLPS